MKQILKLALLYLSILICTSCKESFDVGGVGPCVHEYKEAIFHISALNDSISNMPITFARIVSLKINGIEQRRSFFGEKNYSIIYSDSVYYCNIPCGFGNEPGSYEFRLLAEGYKEKVVKYENVDYSVFKGGCPSFNDGGKRVSIFMSKK